MKRRAALARATAYGGDVCILDEPFKGLDGELAEKSVKRISEVFDKGLIILITHLPEEAAKMADKVIFFKGIPLEITGEIDFDVPPKTEQKVIFASTAREYQKYSGAGQFKGESMDRKSDFQKSDETTALILKAAVKVFSENGYRASTMQMIAKCAGLVPSGIYYYYAGKKSSLKLL